MTEPIQLRARKFLQEFFNDEDLTNFCFDYFPQVYNDFTQGMTKSQKVRMLVVNSQRRGRFNELLAAIERERPKTYPDHFVEKPNLIDSEPRALKPIERNPRQIFISHAHQDVDFAQRLATDLQANGWKTWMAPDNIRPGEKWVEAINRGLSESGTFVLISTPDAVASRWVQREMNAAIGLEDHGKIRLFTLLAKSSIMPPLWSGYQWIVFDNSYEAGLAIFLSELKLYKETLPVPMRETQPEEVHQQREELATNNQSSKDSTKQLESDAFLEPEIQTRLPQTIRKIIRTKPIDLFYGGGVFVFLIVLAAIFWPDPNTTNTPTVEPTEIAEVQVAETAKPESTETTTSTKASTSTVASSSTATVSPSPEPTAISTSTPTSTPSNTPSPTASAPATTQFNQASFQTVTPIPKTNSISLQTPDVYPMDEIIISITPEGSQFTSNTLLKICVDREGRDLNKEGGYASMGGYRIVYNGSAGDFISLFGAELPFTTGGCTGFDAYDPGHYELWGFICITEYACSEGEGWESSSPISFTILN